MTPKRGLGVPRDLPLDGLSLADLPLVAERFVSSRRLNMMMDEKWMGVWRHLLTTVGAVMTTLGILDEATWITISGAILTLIPFAWSWMSKA
jgi:hypothetical protein